MGRKVRRLLISILALTLLFVLFLSPFWQPAQRLSQPWLSSFTKMGSSIGVWFNNVWRLPILILENENLRHQVAELVARQSTSQVVNNENEELRKLISLPIAAGYLKIAVEIIGQQVDETGITYLINRGSHDGLLPGLAAVAGIVKESEPVTNLILIGTLTEVGEYTSRLTLITSSNSEVLAELAQAPETHSLARGEYNLAVRLSLLEIDQKVSVGDTVVTSNLNTLMPPGLLIGTVTTIEKMENQLFQSAVVSPPVTLEKFRFLYVLRAK